MALTISFQEYQQQQVAAHTIPTLRLIEQNTPQLLEGGHWALAPMVVPQAPKMPGYQVGIQDGNTSYGWAHIQPAENSVFATQAGFAESVLTNCIYIDSLWLAEGVQTQNILAGLLYVALRRARILQRCNVIVVLPSLQHPLVPLLKLEPLSNVSPMMIDGMTYYPMAQRLEYAIYHAYQSCHDEVLSFIKTLAADEVIETVNQWRASFFNGPWAQAITQRTLTKQQYIYSLFNLHQYVRQTTQHLGRCVALAPSIELRNHFIYHLRGEVNHELIIERDLQHLGADVDYLMQHHVPQQGTKAFMVVQESTIGFYQDTLLMLACPLAAEGMSAAIQPQFLEDLVATIASWGVAHPKKAVGFLASHVNTDGGDDGHWESVIKMVKNHIATEENLQKFLSILQIAMSSFQQGFDDIIHEMRLWSAVPSRH